MPTADRGTDPPLVTIVVLGEIGQSPRMQNHARALLERGATVDIVAYAGEVTPHWLKEHPRVRLHPLTSARLADRHRLPKLLFVGYSALRVLSLSLGLLVALLFAVRRPGVILVQNPPAIPSLAIAKLAARLRGARLVIDWHNYGCTMLALKLGHDSRLVRWARRYERMFGRLADGHICVSRAMGADLEANWRVADALTLYDLPLDRVPVPTAAERLAFFQRHDFALPPAILESLGAASPDRPALLVSPTSWTADEDFQLLLDALLTCERALPETDDGGPRLLMVLTGKGPLRSQWEAVIGRLKLQKILIRTAWLPAEDYPRLLRLADLGVCFHSSSSGLDLPMKIIDMFAAGLPVCAFDYGPCLGEQVRAGETGLLFKTSAELAEQLLTLLSGFPSETRRLDQLRANLDRPQGPLWADEWARVAGPLIGIGPTAGPEWQEQGVEP